MEVCGEVAYTPVKSGRAQWLLKEMPSFITRENAEKRCQERISLFNVITPRAGYRTRESSRVPQPGYSGSGAAGLSSRQLGTLERTIPPTKSLLFRAMGFEIEAVVREQNEEKR